MKTTYALLTAFPIFAMLACSAPPDSSGSGEEELSQQRKPKPTKASLGALIFADNRLSEPPGQSCATCHAQSHGFADPRPTSTSEGAVSGRFGVRNSPSIAYASFISPLSASGEGSGYGGGLFWDGRAATLQAQAVGPLLNPLEMNNADTTAIQAKLKAAAYASQILVLYGSHALDTPDAAMAALADAIAAFETTGIQHRFTSKYDAYLAGTASLTAAEKSGLDLFESPKTGPCTNGVPPCGCAQCHLDKRKADGSPPLFTDFGYDNIGIPKNTSNPFYALPPELNPGGPGYIDNGLGAVVHNPRQFAHFKAPTLRNVAVTAPYGHNGYFANLKAIVHFYNTRDIPGAWPPPESTFNINQTGLGNLGLTSGDEDDLVTFMNTLTDGYSSTGGP